MTGSEAAVFCQQKKPLSLICSNSGFVRSGEWGIRTLETVVAVYTISNRAPSASSDNSPNYLVIITYLFGNYKSFFEKLPKKFLLMLKQVFQEFLSTVENYPKVIFWDLSVYASNQYNETINCTKISFGLCQKLVNQIKNEKFIAFQRKIW